MNRQNQYYVMLDGVMYGPYTLGQLRAYGLLPDIQVLSTLTNQWMEAQMYPELADSLSEYPVDIVQDEPVREIVDTQRIVYRQKRKAALIGILTLGLAGLSLMGVGEMWRNNIFAGMSFDRGGVGFVMKIISFLFLTVLLAVPFFLISIIQFIYYSIKLM